MEAPAIDLAAHPELKDIDLSKIDPADRANPSFWEELLRKLKNTTK